MIIPGATNVQTGSVPQQEGIQPNQPQGQSQIQSNPGLPFGNFIPPNTQNVSSQRKYRILDLFWLINPKLMNNPPNLEPNEAHFCVISFNISFGNLRVSLFNFTQNSFKNNVLFINNCERLVSGTVYSTYAFEVSNKDEIDNLLCLEHLITDTGDQWQSQLPTVQIQKTPEQIIINIGEHKYFFTGNQKKMFENACKFCYTTGFYLTGQLHITNNQ